MRQAALFFVVKVGSNPSLMIYH